MEIIPEPLYICWSALMDFEYDPEISASNKDKHGIDFEEAQELWRDEDLLEVKARSDVEPRFFAVGRVAGIPWTDVCAFRNGRVRIISVRRSRKEEVEAYEANLRS